MTVPLALQVAHFTPSSFPLIPVINRYVNQLCRASWNAVVDEEFDTGNGTTVAGISIFYQEFYKRLAIFDNKGFFEAILTQNTGEMNKIAAKGAIIVRIMKYVLTIVEDTEEAQLALFVLGKSHHQKDIRPWQYSIFIETLLNTLAFQLGVAATADVMHAWVNLFGYVFKWMLPSAIEGITLPSELNVNTSTIFDTMSSELAPTAQRTPSYTFGATTKSATAPMTQISTN